MTVNHHDSTVIDAEFDIVEEMRTTLDDLEMAFEAGETTSVPEKMAYLRFLLRDLGDALSGEYEDLRRRRFITKETR
ncbi:MAG: hypothetical protein KKE57_01915 [Proteobacteria bacterium]|nr:hypothetical protein [Pseudomonadota bacterium]